MVSPEQIVSNGGVAVTTGRGLTLTVSETGVPEQEPNVGVTV